jgi:two-component system LytT family response regulator
MMQTNLKAVIVDDELSGIEVLEYALKRHCPEIEIVHTFSSSTEALEKIPSLMPDVLFVDVEMPQLNGFELVEKLASLNIQIIFITAYNEFALKAFRVSALDYLLKPVDIDELKAAVAKLKSLAKPDNQAMDALLEYIKSQKQINKISLSTEKGIHFIDATEVLYCLSSGPYSVFYLKSGQELVCSKSIGEYEKLLGDKGFYRIHNSSLINVEHLKRFVRTDGGYVEMSDGKTLTVSRRKKDEFLSYLGH